ncbi:hypothetical protein Droror1_Dr00022594 [Drosera rotundifolia]
MIYGILDPASTTLGFHPWFAETRDRTPIRTLIVTVFSSLSTAAASRRVSFLPLMDPSDLRSGRSSTTSRCCFTTISHYCKKIEEEADRMRTRTEIEVLSHFSPQRRRVSRRFRSGLDGPLRSQIWTATMGNHP